MPSKGKEVWKVFKIQSLCSGKKEFKIGTTTHYKDINETNQSEDPEQNSSHSKWQVFFQLKFSNYKEYPWTLTWKNSHKVNMMVDTGVSINVIDENTFNRLGDTH